MLKSSLHDQPRDRRCSLGGYLWKMKKMNAQRFYVPKWTKRWFSIEGPDLKWYSTQNAPSCSGSIDLKFVTRVSTVTAENGIHSFRVESSKQRTLLLRAESKRVLDMWCRAIQMHADLVKGGDGTSIVTKSATSLNARVLKKGSLQDKLDETERQLAQIEHKLDVGSHDSMDDDSGMLDEAADSKHQIQDRVREFGAHDLAPVDCASESSDYRVGSLEDKASECFWASHRGGVAVEQNRDYEEQKLDDDELIICEPQERELEAQQQHLQQHLQQQRGRRKRSKRSRSITSLLTRKHVKVHVQP